VRVAQFRVEFVLDPASGKYLAEMYNPDDPEELLVRTEAVYPTQAAAVLRRGEPFQERDLKISAAHFKSTFPPESTTPTRRPAKEIFFCKSAQAPKAPVGSTTTFRPLPKEKHRAQKLVVGHGEHFVDVLKHQRQGHVARDWVRHRPRPCRARRCGPSSSA